MAADWFSDTDPRALDLNAASRWPDLSVDRTPSACEINKFRVLWQWYQMTLSDFFRQPKVGRQRRRNIV